MGVLAAMSWLSSTPSGSPAGMRRRMPPHTGATGGCYMCHGDDGKGIKSMGAANLTDKIWTIANVPAAQSPADKLAAVKTVIGNGVQNVRKMPAWGERLSAAKFQTFIQVVANPV